MPDAESKSFDRPDNVVEFPRIRTRIVELGDLTVGELVSQPGWRWSEHVRPTVGGEWCQARHVGLLHCAAAIRRSAEEEGVRMRAGVHVGEVELVGNDVRGVTVHEAARIMSAADADEILVSELTRALAGASGLRFEDRGARTLKGLEGEWRLAAFLSEPERVGA